jgi:hypothetical protein
VGKTSQQALPLDHRRKSARRDKRPVAGDDRKRPSSAAKTTGPRTVLSDMKSEVTISGNAEMSFKRSENAIAARAYAFVGDLTCSATDSC